jgi:hypothetical protein
MSAICAPSEIATHDMQLAVQQVQGIQRQNPRGRRDGTSRTVTPEHHKDDAFQHTRQRNLAQVLPKLNACKPEAMTAREIDK